MKIYISEKYLDLELLSKSEAIVVGSDFDILSPMGADGGEYVLAEVQEDAEVQTIEQHEAEIRKPLEEEIAKLKQDINDCKQRFISSEKRYYDLTISSSECINAKEKAFNKKLKQAKQEVVEELLRLVNTLGIIGKSKSFVYGYDFAQEQIKLKLNEMKGGSDEYGKFDLR